MFLSYAAQSGDVTKRWKPFSSSFDFNLKEINDCEIQDVVADTSRAYHFKFMHQC